MVLTKTRGQAVDLRRVSIVLGERLRQGGIIGLTFHDLRGSAVVRLRLADATVPQIATFTGQACIDVEEILDAHYLGRDVKLAEIPMMKIETRTKL